MSNVFRYCVVWLTVMRRESMRFECSSDVGIEVEMLRMAQH